MPRLSLLFLVAGLIGTAARLPAQDPVRSESLLPGTTRAWISIPDAEVLFDQIKLTSLGRLAEKETMKPFVQQLEGQIKAQLDKQNMRLGITIDDLREVKAAEICVAGVLPKLEAGQEKLTRGSHGLVILADVSGQEEKAQNLLQKIEAEMQAHGAEQVPTDEILGVKVNKWKLPINEAQFQRHTFHTLTDGWLIASDNDSIFREVLSRLKATDRGAFGDSLGNNPTFQKIVNETKLEGVDPQVRWFVEPFGYVELAQAIADEDALIKQPRNDHAAILRKEGFDALKGIGGALALNVGDQDVVHRTYVHVIKPEGSDLNGQRAIGMLDFRNQWDCDFQPEPMIGGSSASYLTVTWNMKRAYDNVGPIFDAFVDENAFEKMVESFKTDPSMNVDLAKLVSLFNNRITVVSNHKRPIDERSEQIAFVVPIREQSDQVWKWVKKLVGGDGEVVDEGDRSYIVIDSTDDGPSLEDIDPVFGDPSEAEKQEDDEEEMAFNLFEKKYIIVERDYLIVANDWDFIKQLLDGTEANLAQQEDFVLVNEALNKLIEPQRLSAREFGRIDRMLETNYEMLRRGKMASSQTAVARILNRVFKSKETPLGGRQQKIDGTTLPENYADAVAPYLGPSGWACETTEDGWLFSGCILKKKGLDELVKKPENKQQR